MSMASSLRKLVSCVILDLDGTLLNTGKFVIWYLFFLSVLCVLCNISHQNLVQSTCFCSMDMLVKLLSVHQGMLNVVPVYSMI